jgi:4-alpha-glucanotransferase
VLLHPTSLPSGRLDTDVERFLDFMQRQGLRVWQMLPLGIPDHTGSPYQSCSAFAAYPGLLGLDDEDLVLEVDDDSALMAFRAQEAYWVEDFARFMVLRRHFEGAAWYDWPVALRDRDPAALAGFVAQFHGAIEAEVVEQFLLQRRWQAIRAAAAERDILLFGDMPIFVALDSADVWANQDQFLLDDNAQPTHVAGVPPDYFSETGQRWGNPHYNWERMQQDDFAWWHARIRRLLSWFDLVRLDHFRGLLESWMIPADAQTAIEGYWQAVPGEQLLDSLHKEFEDLPIVAEDLGVITPEVDALRQQFELPGMAVLQFSFDAFEDNPHKPGNIGLDRVVYTGTHDNNTTLGWYRTLDGDAQRHVREVLQLNEDDDVVNAMLDTALKTEGALAMFPMQDLLGLGEDARMNVPGKTDANWQWRFGWSQVDGAAGRLKHFSELVSMTGRADEC